MKELKYNVANASAKFEFIREQIRELHMKNSKNGLTIIQMILRHLGMILNHRGTAMTNCMVE